MDSKVFFTRLRKTHKLEKFTAISRELHRKFFLKLIKYESISLFKRYVIDATKSLEMKDLTHLFTQAGFNGCIG